ncbi:hypothetical protein BJ508DRAFT_316383, partial [Ascobolus immersus RN42]
MPALACWVVWVVALRMGPKKKTDSGAGAKPVRIRAVRPTKAEQALNQQQGERELTPFAPQRCSCSIFGKGLEPHLIERSSVWNEHQIFLQREYTRNRPVGIQSQRKHTRGQQEKERKHVIADTDLHGLQPPQKRPRSQASSTLYESLSHDQRRLYAEDGASRGNVGMGKYDALINHE